MHKSVLNSFNPEQEKSNSNFSQKIDDFLKTIFLEFKPDRLLPSVIAGAVTAIMTITIAAAFGMLLFSGDLSDFLASGIGFMIFGQMVIVLISALSSSFKSAVSGLQEAPMAIFALITTAIIQMIPGTQPEERFVTVVAVIALSTIVTGVVCWLLGYMKLGDFVRYIPYPVIGGFLAGSGLLLVLGSISIMADVPATLVDLEWLTNPSLYLKWIPGILFAIAIILVLRKYSHFLVVPATLFIAILLFYMVLLVTQTSIPAAIDMGYLPKIFTGLGGGIWKPLDTEALSRVNWTVIYNQMGSVFAVIIISVIAILLNVTALEITTNEKIDLNQELKSTGIANFFSGLGGGAIGFIGIGYTQLTYKINAKSRMVGVIQSLLCLLVLLFGGTIFSYFPTAVLSGFLAFVGFDLLVVWVYDAWKRMPRIDYAMMMIIMIVINLFGILEGVGLGLLLTVVQFIIKYSTVSVVKHELSGKCYRSNVVRPRVYQQLLAQKGEWMYILELQGFIFFGTANRLFERIQKRFENSELLSTKYIVLDFRQVTGLDTSAVFSFEKLIQLTRNQNVQIIFTHTGIDIVRQMSVFLSEYKLEPYLFDDLDHGVEWCENQMIETFESVGFGQRPESLTRQLEKALAGKEAVARLEKYMEKRIIEKGTCIIQQGERQNVLFFIESGSVTVWLEDGVHGKVRIRTMGCGTVVGELGFYLGSKATASVIADENSTLYQLSREKLDELEKEDVAIAKTFHQFLAVLLSERLVQTNDVLQAYIH